jgi:hypothetical protein
MSQGGWTIDRAEPPLLIVTAVGVGTKVNHLTVVELLGEDPPPPCRGDFNPEETRALRSLWAHFDGSGDSPVVRRSLHEDQGIGACL